ncbi:MAG: hypothetical protein ACHQFX_17385 [Chitinophagales bacterium]
MKHNFIIFFLLLNAVSFSQVELRCVYNDTLSTIMPDVTIQKIQAELREKNIPQEIIDTLVKKMSSGPVLTERIRYVSAYKDSTLITLETLEKGALRNNSIASEYFLLKKGELYITDRQGDPDSMVTKPRKVFKSTGRLPFYFDNVCKEYISTDSTCTIWVAEQLPGSINPGVRVGEIKGAVLYYQLKIAEGIWLRCGIATVGKRS